MHIMIFQLQDNVFNCIYWPFHSSKEWQIFMALWNLKMHLINNEFYDKLSYNISMQLSSNMSSCIKFFNNSQQFLYTIEILKYFPVLYIEQNVMIRFLPLILINQLH